MRRFRLRHQPKVLYKSRIIGRSASNGLPRIFVEVDRTRGSRSCIFLAARRSVWRPCIVVLRGTDTIGKDPPYIR